jgi:hypothetical protein
MASGRESGQKSLPEGRAKGVCGGCQPLCVATGQKGVLRLGGVRGGVRGGEGEELILLDSLSSLMQLLQFIVYSHENASLVS